MEIQYKKLTEKELDTFIQMRINQLKEEGATEEWMRNCTDNSVGYGCAFVYWFRLRKEWKFYAL